MATTVLNGSEQSGTFANRPASANNGHVFYATDLRRAFVYDATLEAWLAIDGNSVTATGYLFDDFRGNALENSWKTGTGDDAQAVAAAIDVDAEEGLVVATTGNAGDTVAHDGVALGRVPSLEAEEGQLVFATRFKVDSVANVAFFVGFTDTDPSATLEMPATLSGTTYTTTATDAVGFLFDTAATTDTIRAVGVKNNTDATHVNTSIVPVDDTFLDLKIEVSTAGVATFYIDGTLVATVADAVSVGVDLTPIIVATARTTTSKTWTADHLLAECKAS